MCHTGGAQLQPFLSDQFAQSRAGARLGRARRDRRQPDARRVLLLHFRGLQRDCDGYDRFRRRNTAVPEHDAHERRTHDALVAGDHADQRRLRPRRGFRERLASGSNDEARLLLGEPCVAGSRTSDGVAARSAEHPRPNTRRRGRGRPRLLRNERAVATNQAGTRHHANHVALPAARLRACGRTCAKPPTPSSMWRRPASTG